MKVRIAVLVLALCAIAAPAGAGTRASAGVSLGFNSGIGGDASLTLEDFAQGLPFAVRFSGGWVSQDPGNAPLARQVFVNNATDGSPEESGHRFDLRADARYQFARGPLQRTWLVFGPRYSMYHGTFDFIGGNETFDVTTNQFGFGLGLEQLFPVGRHTDLSIGAGVDWYANAAFKGHGTTYNTDGTTVEPQDDFTYADANEAIAQPRFAPRVMVGIHHRIGW